jgi:lysophospholipase L1-like esterase
MTAGEVVSEGFGAPVCPDVLSTTSQGLRPFQIDPQASWPTQLQAMLTRRYLTQTPVIEDYGCNGESTAAGLVRLRRVLPASQAQIMLLLEGANDIVSGPSAIGAAIANLDSMVNYAKGRGLKVVIATLPPENPSAPTTSGNCSARYQAWQSVAPFNVSLKSMAAQENIPVADIFQALNSNVSTYIDCDGLHPTPAGYEAMAKTFYDVVAKNFEAPSTTTAFPSFAPHVDRVRRR